MQTANCFVHIAGDSGTTVPKYQITVSEIAVLRAIHGQDSITEIEPSDNVDPPRTDRQEIARLLAIYGRIGPDGKDSSAVSDLFPGAAARVYQTLDELDIHEDFYKAERRVKPKPAEKVADKPKAAKGKKAADEPAPGEDVEKTLAEEDKLFD